MEKIIETARLILREVNLSDQQDLFDLDREEAVHKYIGTKPLTDISQALTTVQVLQKQYKENGIARWAVIDKTAETFLGWSGLKLWKEPLNGRVNVYELGYRFIPKYWGKGYATESARAWVDYTFNILKQETLYAITDPANKSSKHVLRKLGFAEGKFFEFEGEEVSWFELSKVEWLKRSK